MTLGGKGAAYSGIRASTPTLVIWANQAEPAAGNMKSYGFSDSEVESVKAWVAAVDVKAKQRGVAALTKAVPGATIVEMEAPHTLFWAKPDEVVRLMKAFLEARSRSSP
jgi:hypothetical protein